MSDSAPLLIKRSSLLEVRWIAYQMNTAVAVYVSTSITTDLLPLLMLAGRSSRARCARVAARVRHVQGAGKNRKLQNLRICEAKAFAD
jgi:hypothetical protein